MFLKDVTPGQTVKMGRAVFVVESIKVGLPCRVVALYSDGLRSVFTRPGLTTVSVVR